MATLNINLNNVQPLDSLLTALSALSFAGNGDKYLKVTTGENGFEFAAVSGGAVWGGISGNLPDQTDLQTALGLKANVDDPTFTTKITTPIAQAATSAGLIFRSNSGTQVADFGAGGGNNASFSGGVSITGQLAVDTNTLFVDAVNNRVGVGTSTPAKTFDVVLDASNRIQFESAFGGARIFFEQGSFDSYIFSNGGSMELNSSGFNKSISYAAYLNHTFTNGSATTFQIQRGGGTVTTINSTSQIGAIIQAAAGQTANLLQLRNSAAAVLTHYTNNGAWSPASLADADAANGTVYYSTTASKLVYKDSGGTVNNLY